MSKIGKKAFKQIQVLQALRVSAMDYEQIQERFSDAVSGTMTVLVRNGLVERCGNNSYRITALGRAECPPRRAAMAESRAV